MQSTHFDYIISGAGCAGLSLAMHIVHQIALQTKTVLLVDEVLKNQNDRTWCFWEKEPSPFEAVVHRQWGKLHFFSPDYSGTLAISPYRYKMLRGLDFYQHCFTELSTHPSVTFLQGRVEQFFSGETTGITVDGKTFTAEYVFNSIPEPKPLLGKKDVWLLQHFKGWLIETAEPAFTVDAATLMDFRIPQKKGTAFCYVLPFSEKKALVEYTLFTPSLLQEEEYNTLLQTYISDILKIKSYRICETEFGVIPMTNYSFPKGENNIINIGTAGGQTKGSSGYTFYFIQQHCRQIVERLISRRHPQTDSTPKRFHFYDSVLLEVLNQNSLPGNRIFSTLFEKNKPQDVLAFLNNASTFPTELKIISTLPTFPFLKAAIRQVF